MNLSLMIEIIALTLAVSAVLLQPKRNPSAPPSWANLNPVGRFLLALILVAGAAKITKMVRDGRAQELARANQKALIDRQSAELRALKETNQHLVKVMSVAGGYSARLEGVVTFKASVPEATIRDALKNLFLKFAFVEIRASNRLGEYSGRVDYGAHPEVYRFINLTRVDPASVLIPANARPAPFDAPRSYYFEVRCANLKILNDQRIQYAQYSDDPPVRATVTANPDAWRDFHSLYGIQRVATYRLTIEELGEVAMQEPHVRRM